MLVPKIGNDSRSEIPKLDSKWDVVGFTDGVRQLLQHEQCQPPTTERSEEQRAQQSATMRRARFYIDSQQLAIYINR